MLKAGLNFRPESRGNLGEELGDVLSLVLMIARYEEIDVYEILRGAIKKMKNFDINRK